MYLSLYVSPFTIGLYIPGDFDNREVFILSDFKMLRGQFWASGGPGPGHPLLCV